MNRFDAERAIKESDLPPAARHIMLTLLTFLDKGVLDLGKWSPSLTELARVTGLHRVTITRNLTVLEKDGWLVRHRPPIEKARSKKARTRYVISAARCTQQLELVAQRNQASGREQLALVAESNTASSSVQRRPDPSDQGQIFSQATEKVISVLKEITGKEVPREHAGKVAKQLLPQARTNPLAFIEKCIRNYPDPYMPTPTPPPYKPRPFWEN